MLPAADALVTDGTPPARPTSYDKKVGLVLQGGGALGEAHQAGVYTRLNSIPSAMAVHPKWHADCSATQWSSKAAQLHMYASLRLPDAPFNF